MELNDEDFLECVTLETEMINDVDDMWLFLWFKNVIFSAIGVEKIQTYEAL